MSTTATPPTTTPAPNRAPAAEPTPIRSRRRPAVIGIGAALVAVCGLGGAWLASSGGQTHPVMVAATGIQAGHTVTSTDVRPIQVTGQTEFASAQDAASLVGKVAATDIPAGAVIAPSMLGAVTASKGDSIFGVAVKPGSYPSTGLQAGDRVNLVLASTSSSTTSATAAAPKASAAAASPTSWQASVVAVGQARDDGSRTVDFSMTGTSAIAPAAYGASGQIVIVLEQRGGQ